MNELNLVGKNNFVVKMKSFCVVAVYTVCILMLSSCWSGIKISLETFIQTSPLIVFNSRYNTKATETLSTTIFPIHLLYILQSHSNVAVCCGRD